MTIHLPEDLQRYVDGEVQKGQFASADEAIAEAVRMLRERRPKAGTRRQFQPVTIAGEPLSETVLRERR
jgi:putative addiction module CopG family antidote